MNHLLFIPDLMTLVIGLIMLVAVLSPISRRTGTLGVSLAERFNGIFYEHHGRLAWRTGVTALLTLMFIMFAAPTHFLGDGYDLLGTLGSTTRSIIKPSEMGASYIALGLQSILGGISQKNALTAFQIVSVGSGTISVWLFFLIAGGITENPIKRLLAFTAMIGSGALLLFFGYVETYPLLWPITASYIYFSLRYLNTGKGPFWPLPFLLLGLFIHVQSAVLFPSYIFVLLCRDRGLRIYRKHTSRIWLGAVIVALAVLTLVLYKYYTDLFIKDAFLPLFTGKPIDPAYSIISIVHFIDIFNELVLISPLILVFGVMASFNARQLTRDKNAAFLGLIAAGFLLFILVIDPKLAMPRDWDLFALSGFTLTLVFLTMTADRRLDKLKRFILPFVVILLTAPLPYLITNLSEQSSRKYAEYIMNTDIPRSMSTLVVLHGYNERTGNKAQFDRLTHLYRTRYTNKVNIDRAFNAVKRNDMQTARQLMAMIKPDEYNSNYHKLLAYLAIKEGRTDEALQAVDRALQLKPFIYDLHKTRALVFLKTNQHDSAMANLRRAYALKSDDSDLLQTMASLFFVQEEYDSLRVYATKGYDLDSTDYNADYLLGEAFYALKQLDSLDYYRDLYRAVCAADPLYDSRLVTLDSLAEVLRK